MARIEYGVVVGNTYDKYGSSNPVVKWMVKNFLTAFDELVGQTSPQTIFEAGCGEGHLTSRLIRNTEGRIEALDISESVIEEAKERIEGIPGAENVNFYQGDFLEMEGVISPSDLVVCCEVLEHLEDPQLGLDLLAKTTKSHAILSVPREPLWRGLNMARLSYLSDFGNTPGHLNHWSKREFLEFVSSRFSVVDCRTPVPWTFVLCQPKI